MDCNYIYFIVYKFNRSYMSVDVYRLSSGLLLLVAEEGEK